MAKKISKYANAELIIEKRSVWCVYMGGFYWTLVGCNDDKTAHQNAARAINRQIRIVRRKR